MDDREPRILYLDIEGAGTLAVHDCHDVDEIEVNFGRQVGFQICPVCGGRRAWEHGTSFLMHDENYDEAKVS